MVAPHTSWTLQVEGVVDEQIERLWYEAYVEERGHAGLPADHDRRCLGDSLAERGTMIVARSPDGDVLGTVSTLDVERCDAGFYRDYFSLPDRAAGVSITTKLVVDPAYRQSRLMLDLGRATYKRAIADGIVRDYIDCQDRHVQLFRRLGYVERRRAVHPAYGPSQQMVLDMHDEAHLQRVGSPLLRLLRRWLAVQNRVA